MFSPLNIVIKPSLTERWLYLLVHVFSAFSVYFLEVTLIYQLLLLVVIIASAMRELLSKKPIRVLYWDVQQAEVKVASDKGALQLTQGISQLHLIFNMLYLKIKHLDNSHSHWLIFADSVDEDSYRRLRVAARWASLEPKP